MQVQRMRTFVNLEPGETRSCIGCHEHRTQAPPTRMVSAMKLTPARLGPQPGEVAPRPLHYPSDVQPILDRHCAECHNGKDPKAAPDLRGEMTTLFNRSYENLMQAGWVDTIREWNGASYSMENVEAVPPYTHGSHASKLVKLLRDGHYDAKLSQEEWVKLVTWIDCGAPYYGSYYGRRNLRYLGQPDFRPVPTVESACGIRPEFGELAKAKPIPAELLAWWKLDDASTGMVLDSSGAGREMKVVAATATEGHDGSGGVRFDGRAYLESDSLGAHDAISIALWVKADSLDRQWNPLLFCNDIQPGTVHFSLLPDGTPNVAINTGSDWTHCTAGASMAAGEWHHVALVGDARFGGRAVFYLDGRSIGDEFLSLGMPLDLYGFRIGGWNRWEKTPNNNFHGEIDDLRIYRGTLTAEQGVVPCEGRTTGRQMTFLARGYGRVRRVGWHRRFCAASMTKSLDAFARSPVLSAITRIVARNTKTAIAACVLILGWSAERTATSDVSMSYYICISIRDPKLDLKTCFPPPLDVADVTDTPVGRQIAGGEGEVRKSRAVIVTHNGCSTDIMNRNGRTGDVSDLFCRGLERLCLVCHYPVVLVHFFRERVCDEEVIVKRKAKVVLSEFLGRFPDHVDEDRRYVLMSD